MLPFTISSPSYATQYYVNFSTGSNANNGLSPDTAFADIGYPESAGLLHPGDTVNVAPGTYNKAYVYCSSSTDSAGLSMVCQKTSGTPGAPITYKSTVQYGAKLNCNGSTQDIIEFAIFASYITIDGFDLSCAGSGAFKKYVYAVALFDDNGHLTAKRNYIHDVSINGCSKVGALNGSDTTVNGTNLGYNVFDSNIIHHIGNNSSTNPQCAHQHGIYEPAPHSTITNNIISGVPGLGIHSYGGGVCNQTISNNIVFDNSNGGILLEMTTANGRYNDYCNGAGTDSNTVTNNISFNNGYGMSLNGTPYDGQCGGICLYGPAVGTHNLVSNNIVFGNNPNNQHGGQVQIQSPAIAVGTMSASTSSLFANYRPDKNWAPDSNYNVMNYQSKVGSPAQGSGISSGAPINDILGNVRAGPIDIGSFAND